MDSHGEAEQRKVQIVGRPWWLADKHGMRLLAQEGLDGDRFRRRLSSATQVGWNIDRELCRTRIGSLVVRTSSPCLLLNMRNYILRRTTGSTRLCAFTFQLRQLAYTVLVSTFHRSTSEIFVRQSLLNDLRPRDIQEMAPVLPHQRQDQTGQTAFWFMSLVQNRFHQRDVLAPHQKALESTRPMARFCIE